MTEKEANTTSRDYSPISAWGYFGLQILFAIPVVGFICLIVFSIGAGNINLRNFARSYFCAILIAVIIVVIAALIGGSFLEALLQNLEAAFGSM